MKPIFFFIFIQILTTACSQQQSTIKEPPLLQDITPESSVKPNKTVVVAPQKKIVDKKKSSKQPITIARPQKQKTNTLKIKKKHIPKQTLPSEKTISKLENVIPKKVPVEPVIEKTVTSSEVLNTQTKLQKTLDTPSISEESLPIHYGSTWVLDKRHDITSNKSSCVLKSKTKKFYDGYDNAIMSLQLSPTAFLIKTDSKIDLKYPKVGIYIDQNSPFQFEQLINENNAFNKKDIKGISKQLAEGKQVKIKLGFWPTWPQTATSTINFTLQDFDQAYLALKACQRF